MTVPKPSALQDSSASGMDFRGSGNVVFDNDEAIFEAEADMGNAEQTIDIPKPSENAATAAQWVKDPHTMLTDLTEGLNIVLSDCRMRLADGPFLAYEADESHRLVPVVCLIPLLHAVPIRNAIEDCPFKAEVIEGLLDFLLTSNDDAQKIPYNTLSNLVDAYKRQLRYLADWIEARKILADKTTKKKKTSGQVPLTYEEWFAVIEKLKKAGFSVDKSKVRDVAQAELGKHRSLPSALHQEFVNRRDKGRSGPQSAK